MVEKFNPQSLPFGELMLYQTKQLTEQLLAAVKALGQGPGGGIVAYPHNVENIQVMRLVTVAIPASAQFPTFIVPDGFTLVIKADPTNGLGTVVYVGASAAEASNITSAWPLIPNEFVSFGIKDAYNLWFSGSAAGLGVYLTVERIPS